MRNSQLGKKHPNRKPISDELKQQISTKLKGRKLSKEHKNNISKGMLCSRS